MDASKDCSKGPTECHFQKYLCLRLCAVVFNVPLLGNEQAKRANARISLQDYGGLLKNANKRGVSV